MQKTDIPARRFRGPSRNGKAPMPAMRLVRPPFAARRVGWVLAAMFILTPIGLIFLPWVQSLSASGRVIAYDPSHREQLIEAPIEGLVTNWLVKEGDRVTKGQLLAEMRDSSPLLLPHLRAQREQVEKRREQAVARAKAYADQIIALKRSRDQAIEVAQKRLEMARSREAAARQSVVAANEVKKQAQVTYDIQKRLEPDGLVSKLEMALFEQRRNTAAADVERFEASLKAAQDEVLAFEAEKVKVPFDFDSQINSATALMQAAQAEEAVALRDLEDLDIRIERQESGQEIRSPVDGTVWRVVANAQGGAMAVKAGDPLLRVVPDIPEGQEPTVELWVDGNDSPLITEFIRIKRQEHEQQALAEGTEPDPNFMPPIKVRLQFEGYPAIQWVGWPSAAVGTFGGEVMFVDPTDDGTGRFRILVRPDSEEEAWNPWPSKFSLRQGLRTNGWVLLNRVSLGYELWRRFNGFPPVVASKKDPDSKDAKDDKKGGKPKVPK